MNIFNVIKQALDLWQNPPYTELSPEAITDCANRVAANRFLDLDLTPDACFLTTKTSAFQFSDSASREMNLVATIPDVSRVIRVESRLATSTSEDDWEEERRVSYENWNDAKERGDGNFVAFYGTAPNLKMVINRDPTLLRFRIIYKSLRIIGSDSDVVMVSGAGSDVNDRYIFQSFYFDTSSGKTRRQYNREGFPQADLVASLIWDSSRWQLWDADGNWSYSTLTGQDVDTPDQVTAWYAVQGISPMPVVSADPVATLPSIYEPLFVYDLALEFGEIIDNLSPEFLAKKASKMGYLSIRRDAALKQVDKWRRSQKGLSITTRRSFSDRQPSYGPGPRKFTVRY